MGNWLIGFEIGFDVLYLIAIWTLSLLMLSRRNNLPPGVSKAPMLLAWGFFLLSLGDSGHVGFRVLAYALGGLEKHPALIAWGSMTTKITLALLYILILEAWRERNERPRGIVYALLMGAGILRLALLVAQIVQGNVTQDEMSVTGNVLLIIQGIGAAILILVDGIKKGDRVFTNLSAMIFTSYLFYIPVPLFVERVPMIGMLMIPKTLAYVGMAWITFTTFFRQRSELPNGNRD